MKIPNRRALMYLQSCLSKQTGTCCYMLVLNILNKFYQIYELLYKLCLNYTQRKLLMWYNTTYDINTVL